MLEISLFSKAVSKYYKSGELLQQRTLLFDYFNENLGLVMSILNDYCPELKSQLECKIRLVYALMFAAFEIKNDMNLSVQLYQKL